MLMPKVMRTVLGLIAIIVIGTGVASLFWDKGGPTAGPARTVLDTPVRGEAEARLDLIREACMKHVGRQSSVVRQSSKVVDYAAFNHDVRERDGAFEFVVSFTAFYEDKRPATRTHCVGKLSQDTVDFADVKNEAIGTVVPATPAQPPAPAAPRPRRSAS